MCVCVCVRKGSVHSLLSVLRSVYEYMYVYMYLLLRRGKEHQKVSVDLG